MCWLFGVEGGGGGRGGGGGGERERVSECECRCCKSVKMSPAMAD